MNKYHQNIREYWDDALILGWSFATKARSKMPPPCPNSRASCHRPVMNEKHTVVAFVMSLTPCWNSRKFSGGKHTAEEKHWDLEVHAARNNSMLNSRWCQACCASSPCHAISSNTVKASSVYVVKLKTTLQQPLLLEVMTRYNEDLVFTIFYPNTKNYCYCSSELCPKERQHLRCTWVLQNTSTNRWLHPGGNTLNQKPRPIWSASTTCQQKGGCLPLFGHLAAPLEVMNFGACHLWTLRSGWKKREKYKQTVANW